MLFTKRKLASVQKIISVEKHPDADRIDIAKVLGWQCVVGRNEFKAGDLCIYIEIDSVLPDRPEFKLARSRSNRVKTIRLRGVFSQGIAFPVDVLSSVGFEGSLEVGLDVTDALGITKYEPKIPAQLNGVAKGYFPSFVPKTDETRVQTIPDVLVRHKGKMFVKTEKIDGTSATYYLKDGDFGACSRNVDLLEDERNTFWIVAKTHRIKEKLTKYEKNIAVQGEILGPGIQDNKYDLKEHRFYLFDVFDVDKHRYLYHKEMVKFANSYGFETVPILSDRFVPGNSVEDLIEAAEGPSVINPKIRREGLVLRSVTEATEFGRLSFKVENKYYRLKYD